ncbi:MAG: hypothetical protein ACJ757_10630 [Gaiellaceae bacterium]
MSIAVEQYVSVPVPVSRVPEVYALLAGTPAKTTLHALEDRAVAGQATVGGTSWTQPEIERDVKESPETVNVIQKALASRPGEEVTLADVEAALTDATGKPWTPQMVRGSLGAWARRVQNRYGQPQWYFEIIWDGEKVAYRMSVEVAQIIQAL